MFTVNGQSSRLVVFLEGRGMLELDRGIIEGRCNHEPSRVVAKAEEMLRGK